MCRAIVRYEKRIERAIMSASLCRLSDRFAALIRFWHVADVAERSTDVQAGMSRRLSRPMVGSIRALPNAPAMKREVEEDWGLHQKEAPLPGPTKDFSTPQKFFRCQCRWRRYRRPPYRATFC